MNLRVCGCFQITFHESARGTGHLAIPGMGKHGSKAEYKVRKRNIQRFIIITVVSMLYASKRKRANDNRSIRTQSCHQSSIISNQCDIMVQQNIFVCVAFVCLHLCTCRCMCDVCSEIRRRLCDVRCGTCRLMCDVCFDICRCLYVTYVDTCRRLCVTSVVTPGGACL